MIIACTEERAARVFDNYRNVAAFTLGKKAGAYSSNGVNIAYSTLSFLPDEDTVNAVKSGDMALKKVIKRAANAVKSPSTDPEQSAIGLGVTQLVMMVTNTRRRKGPTVIVLLKDEADPDRSKIMLKYLKGILEPYGLKILDENETIKVKAKKGKKKKKGKMEKVSKIDWIFKKRKKVIKKVLQYTNKKDNGCMLDIKGASLKRYNCAYYALELRQMGMVDLKASEMDSDMMKRCCKSLLEMYTAMNLASVHSKKKAKALAKKDKKAVKAYKVLQEIMQSVDPNVNLPDVKYGQRKKKGKADGPKMKTKKFKKFFSKKKNRFLLILIYAHSLAMLLGTKPGTKEYNAHMKSVCNNFDAAFTKNFISAANNYAKDNEKTNA